MELVHEYAVAGHNGGPPDDDDGHETDNSPPTAEEARIVFAAVRYVQWKSEREDVLTKRKGGATLGWRLALVNCLKDRVRQNSLRQLLKLNRKTMGENQQRADRWAEHDEEHGTGEFGEMIARLREAIIADGLIDVEAMTVRLKEYVKLDPELRELERMQREHEAAAAEAERAADELEARARERVRRARANDVSKALKGVKGAATIVAQHRGPKDIAKRASEAALAVVERLIKKSAKGIYPPTSDLHADGLKECFKLGLARSAEPHLSKADDPKVGPTALCAQVYAEAIAQKRLKPPKKKGERKPARK